MKYESDWPAPDYWRTICDVGAEGCLHTPAEAAGKQREGG